MQSLGSLVNTRPRVLTPGAGRQAAASVRPVPTPPKQGPAGGSSKHTLRPALLSLEFAALTQVGVRGVSAVTARLRVFACSSVSVSVCVSVCPSLSVCVHPRWGVRVSQYLRTPTYMSARVHVPECDPGSVCDPVCAHVPVCPGTHACVRAWWMSSHVCVRVSWCTCACSCAMAVRAHLHVWARVCESRRACLNLPLCECVSPRSHMESQGACMGVSVCVSPRGFLVEGVCGLEKHIHCYSRFGE